MEVEPVKFNSFPKAPNVWESTNCFETWTNHIICSQSCLARWSSTSQLLFFVRISASLTWWRWSFAGAWRPSFERRMSSSGNLWLLHGASKNQFEKHQASKRINILVSIKSCKMFEHVWRWLTMILYQLKLRIGFKAYRRTGHTDVTSTGVAGRWMVKEVWDSNIRFLAAKTRGEDMGKPNCEIGCNFESLVTFFTYFYIFLPFMDIIIHSISELLYTVYRKV